MKDQNTMTVILVDVYGSGYTVLEDWTRPTDTERVWYCNTNRPTNRKMAENRLDRLSKKCHIDLKEHYWDGHGPYLPRGYEGRLLR